MPTTTKKVLLKRKDGTAALWMETRGDSRYLCDDLGSELALIPPGRAPDALIDAWKSRVNFKDTYQVKSGAGALLFSSEDLIECLHFCRQINGATKVFRVSDDRLLAMKGPGGIGIPDDESTSTSKEDHDETKAN